MKDRIVELAKTYLTFLCVFALQKPLFMLFYHALYGGAAFADWGRVVWHGLTLDFSVAAYFSVLPGLLTIVSAWTRSPAVHWIYRAYYMLAGLLIAFIFILDLSLYEYWGFRLDATPVFYFFSSPGDAVASVSGWVVAAGVLAVGVYAALIYGFFHAVLLRKAVWNRMRPSRCPFGVSFAMLVLTAALFIPIRGGFTVASMNTGHVYFSTDQRLNHAAINPVFSLMESLSKQKDFGAQYRFVPADEAKRLMDALIDPAVLRKTAAKSASSASMSGISGRDTVSWLSDARPDVLFIILESFSAHLMGSLGGEPVAVCLDSIAAQGVLFTNFYANGVRTDKGVVSILSGYPAQPTTSIMKYPHKSQSLPSVSRSLCRAGYEAHYYYGGDINFTNMQSYLRSAGFRSIVSDVDFPLTQRLGKWGAHDHVVFGRLLDDLTAEAAEMTAAASDTAARSVMEPSVSRPHRFRVLQTSSSHEPFEVPYRRLENDRLNAFAYTDSCVGDFIRRFRRLPQWAHTLVVLVPDHLGAYPENIGNLDVARYHVPLILTGGVIRAPRRVDVYGSQQDIAATLLAWLGLPHDEFTFSKDMLNPASPHFAFFTCPDAFGFVDAGNRLVYDCPSGQVVVDEGPSPGRNLLPGQAYLQSLYDDLAGR